MGASLEVFSRLCPILQDEIGIEVPGVFVADSRHFGSVFAKLPLLRETELLKEWELTGAGAAASPDMDRIGRYEAELGVPTLWNSLLADRRIFFGRLCKSRQDYRPRFGYGQLLGILDTFLVEIDAFLERTRPDVILSFGTATLGDYLFFLFAKRRGIAYLQLKSTKVKNYVAVQDNAAGVSSWLQQRYLSDEPFDDGVVAEARSFIDEVKNRGVKYEGAILSGRRIMARRLLDAPKSLLAGCRSAFRILLDPVTRRDNHLTPPLASAFYKSVAQPVRAFALQSALPFLDLERLEAEAPFVFYPLHFEPEVSLQVYGKPFQNQVELVRNLSLSVPVGTRIVVKEHPRSLGFRSRSYYRKLLDMPNVRLCDPFTPAIEIVKRAAAVAVVSGTIGFEAAVVGKPVMVFGTVPYEFLPDTMVKRALDPRDLGAELAGLMAGYEYDGAALERYVCAIISQSVPADLYTALYRKGRRFQAGREDLSLDERASADYERLARYLKERIAGSLPE